MNDIDFATATDGAMLAAFAGDGSEAAFAALVGRHQTMVYNACVRNLRQSADAEDASQAVFLALSHKASDAGLHARATLAGWLHEASWHVCARMREAAEVRKKREREAAAMHEQLAASAAQWSSVAPLLDGELKELPEKYRMPIILHYLEQRSVEETAGLMHCSTDAAKQRLCRGRDMLKHCLARRGMALPAVALAALLAKEAAAQSVAPTFASGAAKMAASQLSGHATILAKAAAEATTRALLIRRMRLPLSLLGAVAGLAFAALLGWRMMPASPAPLNNKAPETVVKVDKAAELPGVDKQEVAQQARDNNQDLQLGQSAFDRPVGQSAFDPARYSNAAVRPDRVQKLKEEKKEEAPFPEENKQ